MGRDDCAISELARRLSEVDGTLASWIGEIFGAALRNQSRRIDRPDRCGAFRATPARTIQRNSHRPKLLAAPAVSGRRILSAHCGGRGLVNVATLDRLRTLATG